MHLEKLFQLYLEQAKKLVLTFCDNERTRACQWIKKIELAPNPDEKVKIHQLHSLKLLLLCLESNCLIGPFEESPVEDKEFSQYDWESYKLTDFSNMIRSKRDKRKRPDVSYAVSGNRRELVTYQDDPATGQHCYYACSKQPIEEWTNLQGGVINNESIDQWKEHGEFEELNRKESQKSSPDIPRCEKHATNSEIELSLNDEHDRNSCRFQSIQHSSNNSNYITSGPSGHTNYQRINTERPETPQRFGGMRGQARPYEIEQFGLSQNEHFRSPRGVFQNLDYDRFQTHRSPMPPRLTDDVIDSFENARPHRGPLNEIKQNEAKKKLCARLQTIRDGMNKKPQVEIEHQIEVEPEMVPYERITLQEPCEDTYLHQDTDQDLGILSARDMDDEVLFGDHQTLDPRTIFKTKNENLVSRNVVKIETNTTINGSKREVIEEVLEQEDVNVVERTDEEDENLVDVSEPTYQSLSGHSPLLLNDQNKREYEKSKSKPRRVLADYSDLPQENWEDISKPSFQMGSCCQEQERGKLQYVPIEKNRFYSNKSHLMGESIPERGYWKLDEVCQPDFSTSVEEVDVSERLENICQPGFASSLEKSIPSSLIEQGNEYSINQRRSQQVDIPPYRRLPHVESSERLDEVSRPSFLHYTEIPYQDPTKKTWCSPRQVGTSERLDQVSHPVFLSSIEDTYQNSTKSKFHSTQRAMPQVNTSERLDQTSYPSFMTSIQDSTAPSRRGRCISPCRRLPKVDISERLDEVSQPRFLNSTEVPYQDLTKRTRCPTSQRPLPQVDTSERIEQISHPSYVTSFQESTIPSRRDESMLPRRRLLQVDASEILDEVSQPGCMHSTEVSDQDSTRRSKCPTSQRPLPQREISERLDQVSHPVFLSSVEDSYQNSTKRSSFHSSQRAMPQVDTSERIDQISHPSFMTSFQNSTVPSRRGRCMAPCRRLPKVDTSERLDEVSQHRFLHSTEVPYQDSKRRTRCPTSQRPLPQVDTSERIEQISHPSYVTSVQDSTVPSRRDEIISPRRRLLQVDASEILDEVSQPGCMHSTEVSYQDSTKRCPTSQRPLPQVDTSERLDQVSHPVFLTSTEDTYQDLTKKSTCSSRQRPMPQVNISERLDQISHPSFMTPFQDSTVSSRRGRCIAPCRNKIDTSERLDEVSQPEFMDSTEVSYHDSTRRTKLSTRQRPLPQVETSEMLDQVSHPGFLSSIEDTYEKSKRRCKCPLPGKALLQNETSERLDQVSQPTNMTSLRDSSLKSRRNRGQSQSRTPFEVQTHESECLNVKCHAEFPTSFQRSSTQNRGICRRTPKQRSFPPVDDSERLENICQPEFPSSFENNIQQSRRQTQDRNFITQENVSERLDDITQPLYASSFEKSQIHRPRESKQGPIHGIEENVERSEILDHSCQRECSSTEDRNTHQDSMLLPQINESEILYAVIQPDLTSFEDTGYGSKDSLHTVSQRIVPQIEESERLEDISQPNFLSSYNDSIVRSRENRQMPKNPLIQSVKSENLNSVCQPSFQSSLEDSNGKPKQRMYTPHSDFESSLQKISRRCKEDPRKKLLSRVDNSEILDDISQPIYPSSVEDSMCVQGNRHELEQRHLLRDEESESLEEDIHLDSTPHRSFPEASESEHLDSVSQPVFKYSLEGPTHTLSISHRSPQRSHKKIDISEKLNNESQPLFPTSFEDSTQNSKRYMETPKRRPLPVIDVSEQLENVCHPPFVSSFEESSNKSRTFEKMRMRRSFPQGEESELLDDVSQPSGFPSSFEHSTNISRGRRLCPLHGNDSGNPSFENSKKMSDRNGQTRDNRHFAQTDISERLNDISQPDFAESFETTGPRSMRLSEQRHLNQTEFSKHKSTKDNHIRQQRNHKIDVSEILDNVYPPSFPNSLEDSRRYSRRNNSKPNQETFSNATHQNVVQPDGSCSLDRSYRNSKRIPLQTPHHFDNSEMLEECVQPEFPSTFQGSAKVSSERRSTVADNRAIPQIDLSENIESVCQPEFPVSFEDSTRNSRSQNIQQSTYRKNKDYVTNLPAENLADISAPTFHSNYEDSMQRGRGNLYLTQENLEDVSCPSYRITPKQPQRRCEDRQFRGPPRQLFPKQDLTREEVERPGDFRKVFESMPNYASFEQQVASKRNPIASRLKLPVTFDRTMGPCGFQNTNRCPQSSKPDEMTTRQYTIPSNKHNTLRTEDFRENKIRPSIKSQANPCNLQIPMNRNQMDQRPPAPTVSSTRIPLPPSARSQTNVQRQEQRTKLEIPANQERLVKKSSVKFHQTKSTYFKNKEDKSNPNPNRR